MAVTVFVALDFPELSLGYIVLDAARHEVVHRGSYTFVDVVLEHRVRPDKCRLFQTALTGETAQEPTGLIKADVSVGRHFVLIFN